MALQNTSMMVGQFAAENGVGKTRAKRAIHMKNLAEAGRDITEVAASMRLEIRTVQRYARKFAIDIKGYTPDYGDKVMKMLAGRNRQKVKQVKLDKLK